MSLFDFDRKGFRAEISGQNPEELTESLTMMLDGCGELARELKLTLPEVVEMITNRYAEAHDLEITHFECEEEPTGDGHSTVTVMADRWRRN